MRAREITVKAPVLVLLCFPVSSYMAAHKPCMISILGNLMPSESTRHVGGAHTYTYANKTLIHIK